MMYSEEQYNDILAVCRSYKNDYDNAFERIKAQQREINALQEENEQFNEYVECSKRELEMLKAKNENLMRTVEEGREEIELARKETAQEIYEKLIQEIDELEQFYKAVASKVAYTEINLVTTRAARKIVKRVLCKYGATEEFEPNIVTLRLGIGKKDIEIMTTALREYAKNHPKPKCHACEAIDLAEIIENQAKREVEE